MFPWPSPMLAGAEAVSGVAHEMRQPLAAILTNAETSLRWLDGETPNLDKVRQLLKRVVTSACVANDILTGLHAASAPAPSGLIDLNELAQIACTVVRHQAEVHQIDLILELADAPPRAYGDRTQVQQALVNLLINAVQAVERCSRRRITLTTSAGQDGVPTICVTDSGPGVPPESLDRIFNDGFTTKPDGSGFGLALCRSVFRAHGGDIVASNRSEGGAKFTAHLPVVRASQG